MAEGNGENEKPFSHSNLPRKNGEIEGEVESEEEENPIKLDLGLGNEHKVDKRAVSEQVRGTEHHSSTTGSSDTPKREENPFSFKHFLKRDSGSTSYQNTGARPKIYRTTPPNNFEDRGQEGVSTERDSPSYNRNASSRSVGNPELSSVLPDFVQDHLIMEQCYLNHSSNISSPHITANLESFPDFTFKNTSPRESIISDSAGREQREWEEPKTNESSLVSDIQCDLTGIPEQAKSRICTVPLDLPNFSRNVVNGTSRPLVPGDVLPFDLPLVGEASGDSSVAADSLSTRNGASVAEVGVSKSLPDFLSDGPIHSGRHNDTEASVSLTSEFSRNSISTPHTPEGQLQRLQLENERLQREIETSRRQLLEQTRRVQTLEKELQAMQSNEAEGNASLEKAIEQVEDDLKRTTRRAVAAENAVSRLKQENKSLQDEILQLRQENRELRYGGGAAAASAASSSFLSTEEQAQRLAQELRSAAGSAEASLRQLLTGVNNLRMIASTVENMHRIHDRTGDFLDIDDESGPAL
ncbi:uncharacterized protein LOC124605558 [Schistocerca americana]|uniref:uncharacterized protein LOC124605558 n=1 Tax=Schistocerca americana TaxID=7009 RepID=UPI001F4F8A55|nr:uncharacterized protein LOC124605558 [Schistocerca americana]XP_049957518.1 uncharacterized protein LOC126474126 [Schistocerca serialis cubense]